MSYSHLISGLSLATLLLLSGCKKDPEVPVAPVPVADMQVLKLTIKPTWNGAPFDKTTVYAAAGDQRIQVSELKFYLAPLELTNADGTRQLFDADLFNVTNGPAYRTLSIPTGNYQSVKLGLGLPYDLNHRDLATIPVNDPTGNNSGMYWSWATMYRFVIFSGRFDSDPAGTGEPPFIFDLHTGLDTCYRAREIPFNLNVTNDDTARFTVNVDMARFFTDGNQVLHLSDGATWHGAEDINIVLKLADLQIAALSIEAE